MKTLRDTIEFHSQFVPMVAAGQKTQTRRLIKRSNTVFTGGLINGSMQCKYGKTGSELWVTEGGSLREIKIVIIDVWIEKIQDITKSGMFAEGFNPTDVATFMKVMDGIYGEGTILKNPFVWVIEFRRVKI